MRERPRVVPNVAEILAQVETLPREQVPAVLVALAARLAVPAPEPSPKPVERNGADRLLTADEVALRLGMDVATVARRRFPFARKLGRRTIRYSEVGLEQWMRTGGTP